MKKFNYIYLIRNLINNKIYIGKHSTDNYDDGYFGSGVYLKRAIKKYGIENFKKTLLCLCDEENLNEMEKSYIQVYGSTNPDIGYNLTFGGDGGVPTEEVRKKMAEANKGENNPNFGKHHSEKTKKKMSVAHRGKTFSDESKKKMSVAKKGQHHNEETRKKISESLKGKPTSMKGKNHSDKTKQKMSTSKNGKPTKKFKWITLDGQIVEMDKGNVNRWHPDYILIEE